MLLACNPFSVARREFPLEKEEMTLIQADAALLFKWEILGYVTSERFIKLLTFELTPNEIIVFIAGFRTLICCSDRIKMVLDEGTHCKSGAREVCSEGCGCSSVDEHSAFVCKGRKYSGVWTEVIPSV